MSRRIPLPGADELFRSTGSPMTRRPAERPAPERVAPEPTGPGELDASDGSVEDQQEALDAAPARRPTSAPRRRQTAADRRSTGRERHEEKITVYVSSDELIDLEQARLVLRREHGVAVDRGRIVREAISVVLADLEAKGPESILIRRLTGP